MKLVVMISAVLASATLLVPTVAEARPRGEVEQVIATVSYTPAELATADGAARFRNRVDAAIRRMCSAGRERHLYLQDDVKRCISDARRIAQPKVELALANGALRRS